jgi:hypothetical protein
LSPENRRSLTIIETVSATGQYIPPIVIIEGKHFMESWFRDRLHHEELVLLSESGFTNDTLAIRFLHHFIQHANAGPDKPKKLLLMDNHGSHITAEFVSLATANNIVPFTFPAHLTHCMQPLDVGVFLAYKHWHSKAIQYALEKLEFEYTIASFLRDLPGIRAKTLKKDTIKHAFHAAGIWPPNTRKVLQNMAKYEKECTPKPALPQLPPQTPCTTHEFRTGWANIQSKLQNQLSSPTQRKFNSIERGLQSLLDLSDIVQTERDTLYTRISHITSKKPISRRRVQRGGELTAEYAQQLIQNKDQERRQRYTKQLARAQRIAANKAKKELYRAGVIHRRIERIRRRVIQEAEIHDIGLSHLTILIPDPEKEAKEAAQQEPQPSLHPEGFSLAGDPQNWLQSSPPRPLEPSLQWLEDDFVPLEVPESDSGDSDESEESLSNYIRL